MRRRLLAPRISAFVLNIYKAAKVLSPRKIQASLATLEENKYLSSKKKPLAGTYLLNAIENASGLRSH